MNNTHIIQLKFYVVFYTEKTIFCDFHLKKLSYIWYYNIFHIDVVYTGPGYFV